MDRGPLRRAFMKGHTAEENPMVTSTEPAETEMH